MRRSQSGVAFLVALGTGVALGVGTSASARPMEVGKLTQLAGAAGCLTSTRVAGCARVAGVPTAAELAAGGVQVSGDGRSVYVAGFESLGVLRRNPATGSLTQAATSAGCVTWSAARRCVRMVGLGAEECGSFGVEALAVAPEGDALYVATQYIQSPDPCDAEGGEREWTRLDALGRDRIGTVRQSSKPGACFVRDYFNNPTACGRARGLGEFPNDVAVSPDGRHVYVGSLGGVAVFRRSGTAQLQQLAGPVGCLLWNGMPPRGGMPGDCSVGPGASGGTYGLAVGQDGRNVYALVQGEVLAHDLLVLAFARDPRTGALARLPGPSGCLSGRPRSGCRLAKGLTESEVGVQVMTVTRDGRNLYFANDVGIVTVERNTDGSLEPRPGVTPLRRFGKGQFTADMIVAPDGRSLYLAANNALTTYTRNPVTGSLSALQCFTQARKPGCRQALSLGENVNAVTVTPDGKHVYVVGSLSTPEGTHITAYSRRTAG